MPLSNAARALWAKSSVDGTGHPLIAHMLDVAAVAWELLEREPASTLELYARDFGLEAESARRWVCALAALHDLGKASPAFQQKWPPGADRVAALGLTWSRRRPPNEVNHAFVSQVTLPDLLSNESGWKRFAASHAAGAAGCHHGFRAKDTDLRDIGKEKRGIGAWETVRLELYHAVLDTVGVSDAPPIEAFGGEAFMRLAGLVSFADWIGSGFDFAPLGDDLDDYWSGARRRATQALDRIGWSHRRPLTPEPPSLESVFAYLGNEQKPFRARPLQQTVEELLANVSTPSLLLIEAPMGEGKTEAAFYAHLKWQAAIEHRGMYLALPTQATGNMLFTRTCEFLRCLNDRRVPDLQLLHGASLLNDEYQSLKVFANLPSGDEQDGEPATVAAREWFTHKKRALLSEYGVGTVDQAVLSVLNVKHHFIRLWGLANRTVVIDEVHAYDAYTTGLVVTLVRWLHALGSSVALMSATLPDAKRRELLDAFDATDVPGAPYPRITLVSDGQAITKAFAARPLPIIAIQPAPMEIPALAALLTTLASRGGCVACIVNTVQRAQELYSALDDAEFPTYLFHARFPAEERQRREQQVTELFGKNGTNRPERAVLVATQVVEQSLDLDFDVMVTDIAPIDLILQRSGRLHRHDRGLTERRGHPEPTLYVAGMTDGDEPPDFGKPLWFDKVYDRFILLRTWALLRETQRIVPPSDIDAFVQRVYGNEEMADTLSAETQSAFAEAKATWERKSGEDKDDAIKRVIGEPRRKWRNVPQIPVDEEGSKRLRALTRKGEESVTVVLIGPTTCRIALDGNSLCPISSLDDARKIYKWTVRLSRKDVVLAVKDKSIDRSAWEIHPLLRNCYPLILDSASKVFGKTRVTYDAKLGIVYDDAD